MEWLILVVVLGLVTYAVIRSKNDKPNSTNDCDADLAEFQYYYFLRQSW